MTSFVEGLEDYGVKLLIDNIIGGYIAKGEIPATDKPMFEKVAIDTANAVFAEVAKAKGIKPDAA